MMYEYIYETAEETWRETIFRPTLYLHFNVLNLFKYCFFILFNTFYISPSSYSSAVHPSHLLINTSFYSPIHKILLFLFHLACTLFPYSSSSVLFHPTHEQLTLLWSNLTAVTIVTFGKISQPLMSFLAECAAYTHTHGHTDYSQSETQNQRLRGCVCLRVCRCIGGCVGAGMWGE